MLEAELRRRLDVAIEANGTKEAGDLIRREARECGYLVADTSQVDLLGASRLGGLPDLPADAAWPGAINQHGDPCGFAEFVAQFDFATLPEIADFPLPKSGRLWVFLRGWPKIAVLFDASGSAPLARRAAPPGARTSRYAGARVLETTPLRTVQGLSFPTYDARFCDVMMSLERRGDIFTIGREPADALVQLGGCSQNHDMDLRRWIAFRRLGNPEARFADYHGSLARYEAAVADPARHAPFSRSIESTLALLAKERPLVEWIERHRDLLDAEAARWRLLLSFRSRALEIGSGIAFDVFIRHDDLARGDFSNLTSECSMVS